MKTKLFHILEATFAWTEKQSAELREFFSICEECSRNRYTGSPCYPKENENNPDKHHSCYDRTSPISDSNDSSSPGEK